MTAEQATVHVHGLLARRGVDDVESCLNTTPSPLLTLRQAEIDAGGAGRPWWAVVPSGETCPACGEVAP